MGSKLRAKQTIQSIIDRNIHGFNCRLIPGYDGRDSSITELCNQAKSIGFPVMIKSSMGGGGKGMVIVYKEDDLYAQIESCKRISLSSFGSDHVLIEKYLNPVKHIEVQILGDSLGNVRHLYERDCSLQRRYQKIIEETPSSLPKEVLDKITSSATLIAKEVGYVNAGTVEFIVDMKTFNFYFLEVNTRLQVEHPITEMITGIDIVEAQLRIAEGHHIDYCLPKNIERNGHAIECRLYCEDPLKEFYPSSGQILWFEGPPETQIRIDTHMKTGFEVSVHYDPMIAKLISFGRDRKEAIQKMTRSLIGTTIIGNIHHNKSFLLMMLGHEKFLDRSYHTKFIEEDSATELYRVWQNDQWNQNRMEQGIAAFLLDWMLRNHTFGKQWKHIKPGFRNHSSLIDNSQKWVSKKDGRDISISYKFAKEEKHLGYCDYHFNVLYSEGNQTNPNDSQTSTHYVVLSLPRDKSSIADDHPISPRGFLTYNIGDEKYQVKVCQEYSNPRAFYTSAHGQDFLFMKLDRLAGKKATNETTNEGVYKSHINGKIVRIPIKVGDHVKKGDVIMIMESMKMETKILALVDGVVKDIHTSESSLTKEGDLLVVTAPINS